MKKYAFKSGMLRLWLPPKILLIMKLVIVILTVCLVQVSAATFGQRITLSESNASLEQVLKKIKLQSGVNFLYADDLFENIKKVNVKLNNGTLEQALSKVFEDQPVSYEIQQNTVIVKLKEPSFLERVVDAFTPPIDISGLVLDEKGLPLVGANVKVKGFRQAVVTDNEGKFYLPGVDDKAVLIVSFVGYKDVEVGVKASLSVALELKSSELNEVVVAYGKTTQQALTGAVTVVKGEQIQNLPSRSFDKSLQGLVPGLLVTKGSGLPGAAPSNFVLRGIATAADPSNGSTVRNPLIIIDGVPVTQDQFQIYTDNIRIPVTNPLAQLNTSDIETISVLKDASAIALYGSRASNGVIVVTTKRGKSGKTVFTFRHQTDLSKRFLGKINILNQHEYLELLFESYRNLNSPLYSSEAAIYADLRKKFPIIVNTPGDTSFYSQADWYGALFRKNASAISNEISMSGGNEKSNFYFNTEYLKQDGVLAASGFDRKSMRFNFDNVPTDWLKIGINSTTSYSVQDYGIGNRAPSGTPASYMSPLNPIRFTDGSFVFNFPAGGGIGTSLSPNPVAAAALNINKNSAFRGLTKFNAEINFLKHFRLGTTVGFDYMLTESKEKADPRLVDPGNFSTTGVGRIEEQKMRRTTIVSTNILRYNQLFGTDHSLDLLIGQEAQMQSQHFMLIAVRNLSLPYYEEINSPGVSSLRQNAASKKDALLSYFSQANYGFSSKYFFSGTIRRDGSSRFGADKRFGTYWSIGTGWVISNEHFMKKNFGLLEYLKLRGSFGAAGNAGAINALTRYDRLVPYQFMGETGLVPDGNPANPDVRWEQTFTWDAGLEARIWKDRISFTIDIYKRKTKDLLYQTDLQSSTGYQSILRNIGKIQNRGVETSVAVTIIQNQRLSWSIEGSWSANQNKLVKANVNTASLFSIPVGNKEGENFNSFYLPIWAGVNSVDGSPQWLDSAGNIVTVYPGAKGNKFVGKPQPDGFGSISSKINYKAFELFATFYYQYGFKLYIQNDLNNDGYSPYMNQDRRALDRWQEPGDVASNPKRILNNSKGSSLNNSSTRYLFDGDYIRLQNVSIAWNIPVEKIMRLRNTKMKLFLQGANLAVWTKYPAQDPDIVNTIGSSGNASFPSERTYSIGLNITF